MLRSAAAHWILASSDGAVAELLRQFDVTVAGLEAFTRWAEGQAAYGEDVRQAEHDADARRRRVAVTVSRTFAHRLPPEDVVALSLDLDRVMNGAKDAVREAEAMSATPTREVAALASAVTDGVRTLREAVAELVDAPDRAAARAAEGVAAQREAEEIYIAGMVAVSGLDDLAVVVARRELLRRVAEMSADVVKLAERVGYTVVKLP